MKKSEEEPNTKKGTKHKKASLMSFLTYGSTLTTYLAITVTGGFLLFDAATMQPKKFQESLQIRSSNISLYIKVLSKN